MMSKNNTRKARTERLQEFLHGFFDEVVPFGEKELNGHLLVKYRIPNSRQTRVEIYNLPLLQPHRRFNMPERQQPVPSPLMEGK